MSPEEQKKRPSETYLSYSKEAKRLRPDLPILKYYEFMRLRKTINPNTQAVKRMSMKERKQIIKDVLSNLDPKITLSENYIKYCESLRTVYPDIKPFSFNTFRKEVELASSSD